MKKRVTNIDTLSALLDRLVTENIKRFFFDKDGLTEKVQHQDLVIAEIKSRLVGLFLEVYDNGKYEYISENRTFTASNIVENIQDLITNDIHIEGRAQNKNNIDKDFYELTK
jgi:hypothetical protein